jgi:hypothetical protein
MTYFTVISGIFFFREKDHLESLGVHRRIIIKWTFVRNISVEGSNWIHVEKNTNG